MKQKNIDNIECIIKNIDNIELLLDNIMMNIDNINDSDLVIVFKLLLYHHYDFFFSHNILNKFKCIENKHILSWNLLIQFYDIIYKIIINIILVLKFYISLKNKNTFNNIDNLYSKFKSNFDANFSMPRFFFKLNRVSENNKYVMTQQILERLSNCHQLFGRKFFINYKIKRIMNYEFVKMPYLIQKKYSLYIFNSINKIMIIISENIKNFTILQKEMNALLILSSNCN